VGVIKRVGGETAVGERIEGVGVERGETFLISVPFNPIFSGRKGRGGRE